MRVLFVDLTTKLKTLSDLQTRARGGMVSSLLTLPDCLCELGCECAVLSDIEQTGITQAGTRWIDYDTAYSESWDVMVLNRGFYEGFPEIRAKRRILWTHDLPHGGLVPYPNLLKGISAVVFLSKYAEEVWRSYFKDIGRGFVIPNGVDKSLFYPRQKDFNYLIFASAPNRGIKNLPIIFSSAKEVMGNGLYMRAYSHLATMHPNEGAKGQDDTEYAPAYQACVDAGIEVLKPIPQVQLAEELGKASLMVMPTDYAENCSNSVLQSLASGTPVVTTGGLGATPEWVRHNWNGYLTRHQQHDGIIFLLEMTRGVIEILKNRQQHIKMMNNAVKTKNIYTWQEIAEKWMKMFKKII